ncbi:MAG: GNAT family N-acetyltransferase [Candidatus Limnocylindrales bacterium]
MSASSEWPLRPAQATDAAAIAALLSAEGYPAGPGDILERLERWNDGRSAVLVATAREEVVGFVAVHVMPRFEHGDWIARVLALVVDEGARERGVGRELMEAAERHALESGCAFIEVTAGRHRPGALQLYESVGYEQGVAVYLRRRL